MDFNPVPKPNHPRRKRKRGQITKITSKVRHEVLRRSNGSCERCGRSKAYCFEMAHLIQASQGGSGSDPWNVALLCGPSVNSGTCHNWVDYTKEGRQWAVRYQERLIKRYKGDANETR
jgi:5-methylcytosine-specific restriction endonuclease McrA